MMMMLLRRRRRRREMCTYLSAIGNSSAPRSRKGLAESLKAGFLHRNLVSLHPLRKKKGDDDISEDNFAKWPTPSPHPGGLSSPPRTFLSRILPNMDRLSASD